MKNDPVIHAKASKIVEAKKKIVINKIINDLPIQELRAEMQYDEWFGWFEEAYDNGYVAGIGAFDVDGHNEITTTRVHKWLQDQNYQTEYGEQDCMMYYDVDMPRIINDAIKHFTLHLSEREVLEGFKDYMNKINDGNQFHIEMDNNDIDRYLAEKQSKTEKK